MLDDALAHFKREVEPGEGGVALLEALDDAQGVEVVVKLVAAGAHQLVELVFAGVAEGRVADVMHERQRFAEVGVEPERPGDGAADLRHFERVGQTVAEVVGVAPGEDLRLGLEAAESAGVDDAVAVALVVVAVRVRRLGIAPPRGAGGRVPRERARPAAEPAGARAGGWLRWRWGCPGTRP